MISNVQAFQSGQMSYADLVKDIKYPGLYRLTDEFFDTVQSIVSGSTDADTDFVPHDSAAKDSEEQGWTLGHVVVHFTASLEEAAAVAVTLARGVPVEGRSRYEVPWESIHKAQQIQDRLKESRRMCRAFLDAWPSEPHLDLTVTRIPRFGPMSAIGSYVIGILHGESHLDQLREIIRQAKA